ncbi:hypothetical protein BCV70DRAFT_98911 [Testicularia cyperi]|uniref:Uncharacterized protein n=1 Tax=Testicularia cyperi TaxID=1882483 RepID=A0A317XQT1_9BASI|nr:hypothetical protein BCV70DRAFT_98911 [Testicularia cyperi]
MHEKSEGGVIPLFIDTGRSSGGDHKDVTTCSGTMQCGIDRRWMRQPESDVESVASLTSVAGRRSTSSVCKHHSGTASTSSSTVTLTTSPSIDDASRPDRAAVNEYCVKSRFSPSSSALTSPRNVADWLLAQIQDVINTLDLETRSQPASKEDPGMSTLNLTVPSCDDLQGEGLRPSMTLPPELIKEHSPCETEELPDEEAGDPVRRRSCFPLPQTPNSSEALCWDVDVPIKLHKDTNFLEVTEDIESFPRSPCSEYWDGGRQDSPLDPHMESLPWRVECRRVEAIPDPETEATIEAEVCIPVKDFARRRSSLPPQAVLRIDTEIQVAPSDPEHNNGESLPTSTKRQTMLFSTSQAGAEAQYPMNLSGAPKKMPSQAPPCPKAPTRRVTPPKREGRPSTASSALSSVPPSTTRTRKYSQRRPQTSTDEPSNNIQQSRHQLELELLASASAFALMQSSGARRLASEEVVRVGKTSPLKKTNVTVKTCDSAQPMRWRKSADEHPRKTSSSSLREVKTSPTSTQIVDSSRKFNKLRQLLGDEVAPMIKDKPVSRSYGSGFHADHQSGGQPLAYLPSSSKPQYSTRQASHSPPLNRPATSAKSSPGGSLRGQFLAASSSARARIEASLARGSKVRPSTARSAECSCSCGLSRDNDTSENSRRFRRMDSIDNFSQYTFP